MLKKYKHYYKKEHQDLLYAACFLDPLYSQRIDELHYPQHRVDAAKALLCKRIEKYL